MSVYSSSNRKYILQKVQPEKITQLFKTYAPQTNESTVLEITRLLTDPIYEVTRRPEDPNGSDLLGSGGNIYESGMTGSQVQDAIAKGLKVDLNCQVVKNKKTGQLVCQKMTTSSPGFSEVLLIS